MQVVQLDPSAIPSPGVDLPRVATITLTPQARESDAFAIVLNGWSAIDPSNPVELPNFRPRADSTEGARFAVVSERNVSVDLGPVEDGAPSFRDDWGSPPSDWPWPSRRPGPELGLLWLRCDANPEAIPLKVTTRPRSIHHETTLSATIDRRGAEVVDEISVEVAFGVASRLDIALPAGVPAGWEVEGVELAGREPLGPETSSGLRYRLRFARDYADAFKFKVRYRLPFDDPRDGVRESKVRLEPIRVLEGTSTSRRILISAEPGFELKPEAKGWSASSVADSNALSEGGPPPRLAFASVEDKPGPVDLLVNLGPQMSLPGVVSRLWIRSIQRPEDDLATSARFWVEAREGAMAVGLPRGSRWVRARVGGSELPEGNVEPLGADEYRLRFPDAATTGPVLVIIDFVVPAASTSDGWPAIRLLGGGIVQQTLWEVQIPSSRAGVGIPAGWTDENEWFWAGGLWKRRPGQSPVEVWHWLTGGNARQHPGEMFESGEASGLQSYLFSRVGPPEFLRFPIFGRLGLLLLCSGPVLAVGLLVLARRPPPRLIAASLLIFAFAAGSLVDPNVVILALQSSVLGFALWLAALAMNWAFEKAGHPRHAGDGALVVSPSVTASSMIGAVSPAISEESTAIRPRPLHPSAVSTADHVMLIRAPGRIASESPRSEPEDR